MNATSLGAMRCQIRSPFPRISSGLRKIVTGLSGKHHETRHSLRFLLTNPFLDPEQTGPKPFYLGKYCPGSYVFVALGHGGGAELW